MTDLDYDFFVEVLRFRHWTGLSTLITSAYRPGDPRAHGKGLAVDLIMFDVWKKDVTDPLRQWLLGTTWPFKGVGIYFDWNYYKNGKAIPAVGLHVDCGNTSRPVRWLRVEAEINGKPEKLYYYQNTTNGLFWNKKTQGTLELEDVIKRLWQA